MYREKEDAPTSVKAELVDFCETTTLAGLAHVVGERFRWSRILWLIAFLGAVAAALYQVQFLIQKYRRFPINTDVSYENSKKQAFPYVTICNLNPLQKTKIIDSKDDSLERLFDFYRYPGDFNQTQQDEIFGKEPKLDCSGFNFKTVNTTKSPLDYDIYDDDIDDEEMGDPCAQYEDEDDEENYEICEQCRDLFTGEKDDAGERAKTLLREKIIRMNYTNLKDLTQEKEEMVVSCNFMGTTCSSEDFDYVRDPRYGRCIQFRNKENRKAKFTGPAHGLQLVLNLNLDQYSFASNVGARVELHARGTTSYPYGNGVYVSAGQMTSVGMTKLQIIRKGRPYGECINITNDGDLKKNYPHIMTLKKNYNLKSYTVADCESICKYETIKEEADCIIRESPHAFKNTKNSEGETLLSCGITDREKVKMASRNFDKNATCGKIYPKGLKDTQKCPQSCDEEVYLTEISTAVFPADNNYNEVAELLRENELLREEFNLPRLNDSTLDKNWYVDNQYFNETKRAHFEKKVKQNLIRLSAYFKDLNYQKVEQEPGYDFIALVSDLGGNTGLWVGFCVLTIIEWIVLTINCCYAICCTRGKSGRTSPKLNGASEMT